MYSRISELRECVARLACYASVRDFQSVGSVSCQMNILLTEILAEFNEVKAKLDSESTDSELDDSCEPW